MSRETQFIGLSSAADAFLEKYAEVDNFTTLKNGKVISEWTKPRSEENDSYTHGMFDEKIPLKKIRLKVGVFVLEKVQDAPWSSGPVIFTHLTNASGDPIEGTSWTEKEMEQYL